MSSLSSSSSPSETIIPQSFTSNASSTTITTTGTSDSSSSFLLRAVGFCGIDDSIQYPEQLIMMSHSYPVIEWGVLFRPDLEGQPRYPTMKFIENVARVVKKYNNNNNNTTTTKTIQLAAHLCGSRVNDLLYGDLKLNEIFIEQLVEWGFHRIQINATQNNGVHTDQFQKETSIINLLYFIQKYENQLEFIIQKNNETQPLWEALEDYYWNHNNNKSGSWPKNVSMLLDESKGTGVCPTDEKIQSSMNSVDPNNDNKKGIFSYPIGYAGGLGPHNIRDILPKVIHAATTCDQTNHEAMTKASTTTTFWIDMESHIRSIKNQQDDIFDLDKCYAVLQIIHELGYIPPPSYYLG